ncbi:MGT family Glycosyltransferase [Colletotrichum graminicola]|uniref:MGT family Glycosyltransferase n=1 Tax=Colletotrichum graminicola (strain M1.001 / M2 / FGSC 10212) TaxID=645133 RepID=E3QPE7_COLGM|nr:MGT family Glycosyltransferase [Colletotrichum graminicola M1.001]EFQ32735.1 MGT family Glycosyltransferase [Colletotrichum graminicola M1.001]WDK18042.1 MGT family Glycosyltransferase [Colletotrichum graminicola]
MHLSTWDGSAAITADRKHLKFLLHCFSATGHVLPMQAVARELVERGHEVVWTTIAPQEARVVASGAKFFPAEEVIKVDANMDGADPKDMAETAEIMFGGRVTAQVADIRRVLKVFKPDFVLNDALPQGVAALFELDEIPHYATLGVVPLYLPDIGPEPIEHAAQSPLGLLLSQPQLSLPTINSERQKLGLPALKVTDAFSYSPFLHIQASCPSLEFQEGPEPVLPQAQYVGPLVTRVAGANLGVPTWWDDVVNATSVIGITQGTFAMNPTSLIIPAIQALQGDKRHLLVVPSKLADEIREKISVEDNVRIAEWVPYDMLLPRCRLLVTNGGYGSVTQALSHGVPLVCAGTSEDKKDTAARVTWVGAGIDLKTDTPSVNQVRDAVHRVLEENTFAKNAAKVGKELNSQGGAKKACDLLEKAALELGAATASA